MTHKRKPLSTGDMKVTFGGTFGDPTPKSKIEEAVELADEQDATRRRDKPTKDELTAALLSGELSESDREHLRRERHGIARQAGRPKESENARLARDVLLYIEYATHLGKGYDKPAAMATACRKLGLGEKGEKTVEAANTRARKLFRPKK